MLSLHSQNETKIVTCNNFGREFKLIQSFTTGVSLIYVRGSLKEHRRQVKRKKRQYKKSARAESFVCDEWTRIDLYAAEIWKDKLLKFYSHCTVELPSSAGPTAVKSKTEKIKRNQ